MRADRVLVLQRCVKDLLYQQRTRHSHVSRKAFKGLPSERVLHADPELKVTRNSCPFRPLDLRSGYIDRFSPLERSPRDTAGADAQFWSRLAAISTPMLFTIENAYTDSHDPPGAKYRRIRWFALPC